MSPIKTHHLLKPLSKAEAAFDRWKFERRIRKGKLGEIMIFPYRGYGNQHEINIMGRVLENNGLAKPHPEDSTWTNIKAMTRRYMSREIPHVYLKANFLGEEKIVKANEEGYFHLQMPYQQTADPEELWHTIHFRMIDRIIPEQTDISARGEILIPDRKSDYGIISDIDDTVLISKTTNRIEIIRMAMMYNATTRTAFRDVAEFYRALQKGSDGQRHNPFFYVSSSPWNMYDMLEDFFQLRGLPKGPILLRDIGLTATRFIKEKHSKHKLEKIRRIMAYNPGLSFILIGDSGQHDPEIYQQVTVEFPGRVKAIYIRDVTSPKRKALVRSIADEVSAQGIDFVIKTKTSEAVTHAENVGFIPKGSREKVMSSVSSV
ncbi:MAG: App1 family protein [Cyclobacteriaceae bacterium]